MLELPKRITLAEQTAGSIRKAIAEGDWADRLPGERRMSEILKVSRPTVRAAIHLLAKEGWLDTRNGRRNRRILQAARVKPRPGLVSVITPVPMAHWSELAHKAYAEVRARLAAEGFTVEIFVCDAGGARQRQRKVEAHLRQNHVNCCVLLSVSYDLHRWFAARGLPVLLIGSCDPAVRLPSIEVDQRSMARHAAGVFLRMGHRRLALLGNNSGRGGDLACEQGFLEGTHRGPGGETVTAEVARHQNTAASVLAQLDHLYSSKAPPTALLVTNSHHAFTVLYYLLRRGIRVPADVSLLVGDSDPYFPLVSPAFSHYAPEGDAYVNRFARLTLKLVREGRLAPKAKLIAQMYVPGETIGRAPADAGRR